jgi:hypothetical protein
MCRATANGAEAAQTRPWPRGPLVTFARKSPRHGADYAPALALTPDGRKLASGHPGIRASGHPGIRASGHPGNVGLRRPGGRTIRAPP